MRLPFVPRSTHEILLAERDRLLGELQTLRGQLSKREYENQKLVDSIAEKRGLQPIFEKPAPKEGAMQPRLLTRTVKMARKLERESERREQERAVEQGFA